MAYSYFKSVKFLNKTKLIDKSFFLNKTLNFAADIEKFKYEPGQKYVYDFEGVNNVIVAGERKQRAEIKGEAELIVISKCDMVLQVIIQIY